MKEIMKERKHLLFLLDINSHFILVKICRIMSTFSLFIPNHLHASIFSSSDCVKCEWGLMAQNGDGTAALWWYMMALTATNLPPSRHQSQGCLSVLPPPGPGLASMAHHPRNIISSLQALHSASQYYLHRSYFSQAFCFSLTLKMCTLRIGTTYKSQYLHKCIKSK